MPEIAETGVRRALFITGGSGYVGARLLERIDRQKYSRIVCLVREPEAFPGNGCDRKGIELVAGDVQTPSSYRNVLRGCDTVVHLAAVTGKAKPAEYFRVNSDGTRALVQAAKSEGVRDFLHLSTIAVKYSDQHRYFYAHSKKQAEKIVADAGLAHTILRPTIVTGPGAPVVEGLARMARARVMPVFGDGRAAVQPIFIDDLVDSILSILEEGRFFGETIEIGGPEIMSIEEFIARIRLVRFGKQSRPVHLPLRPIRSSLALLEPLLLPVLPLTSGQLALFANDSTILPNPFVEARKDRMTDVETALRMAVSRAEKVRYQAGLESECRVYCRYLIGRSPSDYVRVKYALYHSRSEAKAALPIDGIDGLLLRLSRITPLATRLVDSYSSLFHKNSVVRKKLVLLLAILECTRSTFQEVDSTDQGGRTRIYMKLLARVGVYALSLILATPPLAALHLIMRLAGHNRTQE